jgi:shikimate kinase
MKIYLVGFMGSGKTTFGKRIAERAGFEFVDTDRFIETQQGMTINEIFAKHGQTAFREMEHNTLIDLQKRNYMVVSTGGGMPCCDENINMMLSGGRVVYLKTSPQTLCRRLIRSRTERPLVKGKTEAELYRYITDKLAEREPFYSRAHIVVQTEQFSLDGLLQSLNLMKHT